MNTIVIYDKVSVPPTKTNLPTWNGVTVNAGQIHEYLGLTKMMKPTPTLLLIVSPHADCAEVEAVRQIVDRVLDCGTDQCVQVAP